MPRRHRLGAPARAPEKPGSASRPVRSRRLPGASGRHPSARPATASLQGTPRCTRRRGPTAPADGYRVRPASRGPARSARPPPPGEKTRDSPGEVAIAQRPQLAPELHAVRAPLPPALDHVRRGGPQDLASPLRAAGPRGPGTPPVRIDRGAAEAEVLSNGGHRGPLGVQGMERLGGRHPGSMALLLCRLLPLLPALGAPASPPLPPGRGHRASHRSQRLHGEGGSSLECDPLGGQKGLDGFPQVVDQMKAIHDLHGLRCEVVKISV